MATLRDEKTVTERQAPEDLLWAQGAICGYKRNPKSERPPCSRLIGHQGKHSYDGHRLGR